MTPHLTDYQAKYFAYELQRSYANDHVGKLAGLLFDAQVEPKPHQIDAALFALQTPFLPGVILADEVGLGQRENFHHRETSTPTRPDAPNSPLHPHL